MQTETIGKRIKRLRDGAGWSRPELGRRMASAIGRDEPFSGEVVRLYEENTNRPSVEAREAIAKVFKRSEIYIEFGVTTGSDASDTAPLLPRLRAVALQLRELADAIDSTIGQPAQPARRAALFHAAENKGQPPRLRRGVKVSR